MEQQRTTIESVLCRLEAKELQAVAEGEHEAFHNALMEGMKTQFFVTNGQLATKNKPIISLRDFGLILTRIGLCAIAASEDEEGPDDQD